jgi:copper oxidase (laccase) domain-containing protein
VTAPGEHAGAEADAAVTATRGCALAVRTADCVPIVLRGRAAVGVVHAGWRGLLDGVVPAAVEALRALGGGSVSAVVGAHIRAGCYEFGAGELDAMVARFGDDVRGRTMWGAPALDLTAAVTVALREAGVRRVTDRTGACTACSPAYFSYRARRDTGRMASGAWLRP